MIAHQRIEMRQDAMLGKPVIRGTRVTVEPVRRKLAEGITPDSLLDAEFRLTREDVQAAIQIAAGTLAHEKVVIRLASAERGRTRAIRHRRAWLRASPR
jgi:uncharacterized protein (DUF433 family)